MCKRYSDAGVVPVCIRIYYVAGATQACTPSRLFVGMNKIKI